MNAPTLTHGDILRRADENARQVLTSLVATLGMEAEIVFDDGARDVLRLTTIPAVVPMEPAALPAEETMPL